VFAAYIHTTYIPKHTHAHTHTGVREDATGGRGSALLEQILASSPAKVAADLLKEGRVSEVYAVLEHTCYLLQEERSGAYSLFVPV
jgi:hypothetical protein